MKYSLKIQVLKRMDDGRDGDEVYGRFIMFNATSAHKATSMARMLVELVIAILKEFGRDGC